MLVEILCSNVLGLSIDIAKCSSARLEKLQTLSLNQTAIFTEPSEQDLTGEIIQLAKGRHHESKYRRESDRNFRRHDVEEIRDRGYERRRRLENYYGDYQYDRRGRESFRDRRNDINERIERLERERERLDELDRRDRRRYFWYY